MGCSTSRHFDSLPLIQAGQQKPVGKTPRTTVRCPATTPSASNDSPDGTGESPSTASEQEVILTPSRVDMSPCGGEVLTPPMRTSERCRRTAAAMFGAAQEQSPARQNDGKALLPEDPVRQSTRRLRFRRVQSYARGATPSKSKGRYDLSELHARAADDGILCSPLTSLQEAVDPVDPPSTPAAAAVSSVAEVAVPASETVIPVVDAIEEVAHSGDGSVTSAADDLRRATGTGTALVDPKPPFSEDYAAVVEGVLPEASKSESRGPDAAAALADLSEAHSLLVLKSKRKVSSDFRARLDALQANGLNSDIPPHPADTDLPPHPADTDRTFTPVGPASPQPNAAQRSMSLPATARADLDSPCSAAELDSPCSVAPLDITPAHKNAALRRVLLARAAKAEGTGCAQTPERAVPLLEFSSPNSTYDAMLNPDADISQWECNAVRLQSYVRGHLARTRLEHELSRRAREEWIAYYVACGEYEQARELGWSGSAPEVASAQDPCVIL